MEIVNYTDEECSLTGLRIHGSAVQLSNGRLIGLGAADSTLRNAIRVYESGRLVDLDSLRDLGTACPSQFEGSTYDGRHIYVRFRHGTLSVRAGEEVIYTGHPEGDGVISLDDVCLHLRKHGVGV